MLDPCSQLAGRILKVISRGFAPDCALPYDSTSPTVLRQCFKIPGITPAVAGELFLPELRTGRWQLREATAMPVPEASMHKNRHPIFRKNDIRFAGKVFGVESEAEPLGMKEFPDDQLRRSIFPPDARHHAASGFRVDDVDHQAAKSVRWVEPSFSCMIAGFMMRAISAITGTTTELPNCL